MANELATRPHAELLSDEVLSPVMDLKVAMARLEEFRIFVKEYFKEGEDFGTIPGTPKPTLLKPGADKLCELYGLSDSYEIVDKIEDYEAHPALFDYTIRCTLTRIRTQLPVASGLGSCNSYEGKYRYRDGQRLCPACGKPAIIKGKDEYGGGWLCFLRKGGCGEKFGDDDPKITKQVIGKIENDDIATLKNTILKMAKKRAKIDATLSATRSSGIFTQDIEDMAESGEAPRRSQGQPQQQQQGSAPKKSAGKKQTRARADENMDVMCNECRQVNGHSKDCPTQKKAEPEIISPNRARFFVDSVEEGKTIVRENKETGKKTGGNPYMRLNCLDADKNKVLVCAFHKTMFAHAPSWAKQWILCDVTAKVGSDQNTFYSLDAIHRAGEVQYKDNEPVAEEDPQGLPGVFDGEESPEGIPE